MKKKISKMILSFFIAMLCCTLIARGCILHDGGEGEDGKGRTRKPDG